MAKKVPIEQLRGRTIGRILIKMGLLTREKMHHCLNIQKKRDEKILIGQIMLELGFVKEQQLQQALAAQRGMEFVSLSDYEIPPEIRQQIPAQMANAYRVVPPGL